MSDVKCRHCGVIYQGSEETSLIMRYKDFPLKDQEGGWQVRYSVCPVCSKMTLFLNHVEIIEDSRMHPNAWETKTISETLVHPLMRDRNACPDEVPEYIAEDYREACLVLSLSPKASAALSRRCLQNLLRDVVGVRRSDLSSEIQEAIASGKLPTYLIDSIDAVRNIGNFAAHPAKSKHTGEIVEVEPEEAEWNLDILEALFDHFYIQPAVIARKKAKLNAKLEDAGKPLMK